MSCFAAMLERIVGSLVHGRFVLVAISLTISGVSLAQGTDSVGVVQLPMATVYGDVRSGVHAMPDTLGVFLMAGKRSVVLEPARLFADLSLNHARQVFAKVPGIHVWENDGSGAQLGISTRGLSPNRSWEFNLRQDGRDIAADVFGYPEAYYTPPMEAVERIHVVRGAAALAYGPQFGGMVDFLIRKGAADKPLAGSIRQTIGSYGLFNTYTDIGGTKGKWNYFGFLQHRQAEGWRANSRYNTLAVHGGLRYTVNDRLQFGVSYTHNTLEQQQAGGLVDGELGTAPRQSHRARNWMSIPWNVAAFSVDWRPDGRTVIDVKVFGLMAERKSVGFVRSITVPDTISRATASYAPRQVDQDNYLNLGTELRFRRTWTLKGYDHELSVGLRGYRADNDRRQFGVGTTGSDADFSVSGPYGRELDLTTNNVAFHLENLFRVGQRLSVTPGMRLEHIVSQVDGRIDPSGTGDVDSGERARTVPLFGLGTQFNTTSATVLYANITEAFRPVLYGDLTPAATTEVIDPGLRDAHGYNVDLGYRGRVGKTFTFDAGFFLLHYDDRIGTRMVDGAVQRTNIGASVSKGGEVYVESDLLPHRDAATPAHFSVFVSYAYTDARYTRWNDPAIAEDPQRRIVHNRVENAPEHVLRSGIEAGKGRWSASIQASAVDGVFTDAANTRDPNANATIGWLPGHILVDATAGLRLGQAFQFTIGLNNALDATYATRRAGGYPGPGLLPGMGRHAFATLGAKF